MADPLSVHPANAAGAHPELAGPGLLTLAGCTLGLCCNIATVFNGSFTTFLKPLGAEMHWSRAAVSLGLSSAMAVLLLLLPWAGRLSDRLGSRRVILVGAPLFPLALAALAWLPPSYPVYLALCGLIGLAGAATYNSLYYAILPRWFERRLGLAVGVASAGTGLGLILAPALAQALIAALGWRHAYLALAALTFLCVAPTALFFLKDAPRAAAPDASSAPLSAVVRLGRFWRTAGAYFLTGLAINGTVVHLAPLLTDHGLSPARAAALASLLGAGVLVSRIVSGFLLDYVDAGRLGAVTFLLAAVGIGLLAAPLTSASALAAVTLVGFALGAEGGVLSYVARRAFGLEGYGSIVGLMMSAFLLGVLLGPLAMGAVFDRFGTYGPAQIAFVAATLVAAALHFGATSGATAA